MLRTNCIAFALLGFQVLCLCWGIYEERHGERNREFYRSQLSPYGLNCAQQVIGLRHALTLLSAQPLLIHVMSRSILAT
jgi:hypothetical protein